MGRPRPSALWGPRAALPLLALVLFLALQPDPSSGTLEGEIIGEWAETFGEELWDLGQRITKAPDIKARYKALHVRVERKDGHSLLKSAVETVGRMLSRKMDAIKCILEVAEKFAEQYEYNETDVNLTYYSAKYSQIEGQSPPNIPKTLVNNSWLFRNMSFNVDTHFYNIPVNTSYSSVHVPTNVYDRGQEILETIAWSESLDEVFVQNYNSDPALSWQYFGSSTGVMRQYPAMAWDQSDADLFDCRTRSWFIEAATCSKDVVILFDNSGSMAKHSNLIAIFTVKAILETFSNNDFLNIFTFSNVTFETVPCFRDMLVQATPDNLRTFNEALSQFKPDGQANFTLAFMKAFELLETYRVTRGCNSTYVGCNQAIMLITDGVPGNLTQVFDTYNLQNNGTYIPVRVFTYLIGKEVTNVREIQWMACLNRGYYVHIQSLEDVQEKVLKYIPVIARPLVLQEEDHPITWTHAYADITDPKVSTWLYDIDDSIKTRERLFERAKNIERYKRHGCHPGYSQSRRKVFENLDPQHSENNDNIHYEEYRLMTSVAIPLYDRKVNKKNDTQTADLLGVAGTDVPIEDIDKLTLPYKLGVNGYSFIVSNNGYLLLHPDLRPVYKGILKENYNSIDIVEVEMMDDDLGVRELGRTILDLREAMVGDVEGSMLGIGVRFHYDKMRRISREKQDYYYAPLPKTPFSLGIVLPHGYGNTWIKVGDEIKRNQHLGLKVENFFLGDNWKVHPKWVYCKYHYLEGHEFPNPEAELLHFLHKMGKPNWKWSQQYEPEPNVDPDAESDLNCGRKSLDDDDYYCNKELVQLLVFDAKVTDPSYNTWSFKDEAEEQLFLRYNASLRFAATMSGLTRWQFVFGEDESNTDSEFGDYHTTAIDETWYKSAVLQHTVEPETFVFSVDFNAGCQNPEDVIVTASHAVFPRDGGLQAPAAVLGYQFSHRLLHQRFMEITSSTKCEDCMMSCESDEQDCYIIDSSGYIIISETHNETGKFFGEVEGAIMDAMVNADIFQKVSVFDLQGVCFKTVMKSSIGNVLSTPFKVMTVVLNWFCAQLAQLLLQVNLSFLWNPLAVFSQEDDADYYDAYDSTGEDGGPLRGTPPPRKMRKGFDVEEEEYFSRPREPVWVQQDFPCDRQANLFVLQQHHFIHGDGFMANGPTNCSRPYFVKRIPHSNLVLVVVNTMYPSCYKRIQAAARPIEEGLGDGAPCHKLQLAGLPRRRLEGCYTDHPLEQEIEDCGRAGDLRISIFMLILCWFILLSKRFII